MISEDHYYLGENVDHDVALQEGQKPAYIQGGTMPVFEIFNPLDETLVIVFCSLNC